MIVKFEGNDFSLHLLVSEQFPNEFVVSIASFKSSLIQYDVHFVNYSHIKGKIGLAI